MYNIAPLVPNFQIARNRQAQRRCHTSKRRGHTLSHPMKNHTNKPVLVSRNFSVETGCNADGAVKCLDRTFINFNESGCLPKLSLERFRMV